MRTYKKEHSTQFFFYPYKIDFLKFSFWYTDLITTETEVFITHMLADLQVQVLVFKRIKFLIQLHLKATYKMSGSEIF